MYAVISSLCALSSCNVCCCHPATARIQAITRMHAHTRALLSLGPSLNHDQDSHPRVATAASSYLSPAGSTPRCSGRGALRCSQLILDSCGCFPSSSLPSSIFETRTHTPQPARPAAVFVARAATHASRAHVHVSRDRPLTPGPRAPVRHRRQGTLPPSLPRPRSAQQPRCPRWPQRIRRPPALPAH